MQAKIAYPQYKLNPADLALLLGLARGGTLAAAGERLGVDASTVFRSLQKLERGLGRQLFERGRGGYRPGDLAQQLVEQAEQMEAALESARSLLSERPSQITGTVRITTTDTLLHGLVAPALKDLRHEHPELRYELHTGNELASLTRRDADIALRATKRPPQHLVGRCLGNIRVALYGPRRGGPRSLETADTVDWIAPDEALPEHPSVVWRKRHYPRLKPRYQVGSIQSVLELVAQGLGVGVVPIFLAEGRSDVKRLSEPLDEAQTELWLLTHADARHLRRVATVYAALGEGIDLP
ncbi:LysR family transcriptional regulator [Pelomonas sp. SE-A7]|uniref:LysR family transcriptional regulator n=1 Tax=Pelomonas sp. SE-A7 TaxID=3054953 RepID=UPI00259CFB41|nr:LysR family transcriptional regulator [Pelomonas sp. SE-A7]MDM4766284.1 LysR family transcriptional regulator [Pelomonas sp. SE-A7]